MAAKKLRVGICGLGFMGRTHLAHAAAREDVTIIALADRNADRLALRSRSEGNLPVPDAPLDALAGAKRYADAFELIDDPDVDALVMTLPTPLHADVCSRALEAGKHVFCEKPMALTLAECDRMLHVARQARRQLMIAHCIRFWPEYEAIRDVLQTGRLGEVRFASLKRITSPPAFGADNWYLNGALSGGAMFDLHVHDIDWIYAVFGLPKEIAAIGKSGVSGANDHVLATYHYPDGKYVNIESGWLYTKPFPFEMAVLISGSAGTVHWSSQWNRPPELYAGDGEPEVLEVGGGSGWGRTLDYFLDCVRDDQPVALCSPEDSRTTVALAHLECQAIASGQQIVVEPALR